jgi:hypothetical protein
VHSKDNRSEGGGDEAHWGEQGGSEGNRGERGGLCVDLDFLVIGASVVRQIGEGPTRVGENLHILSVWCTHITMYICEWVCVCVNVCKCIFIYVCLRGRRGPSTRP